MTWIAKIRQRAITQGIEGRREFYAAPRTPEQSQEEQLRLWNREWSRLLEHAPYYRRLQSRLGLPREFRSWQEFSECVPKTTRSDVQRHKAEMTSDERPPQFFRQTGGSTAQPVQLPAWKSELTYTNYDTWLGRSWYDVTPRSRLFTIWGHSHLLGRGFKGRLNKWNRIVRDWMLGYCRFSAYELQPAKLRRAAQLLLRFRPAWFVGYSVALDLFARVNEDLRDDLRSVGLLAVIGAAEAFPAPDSEQRLRDLFGCPVGMEYGSVETNLMGHTAPGGGYRAFWRTYFLEVENKGFGVGAQKLYVTSLYPRCFPLVRYEIGDEIELLPEEPGHLGIRVFRRVVGRCNDYVEMPGGAKIHSEAFTHAIRDRSELMGYQVRQTKQGIQLLVTSPQKIDDNIRQSVREQLVKIHPQLATVEIVQVDQLERTIAGKTRMVVRYES